MADGAGIFPEFQFSLRQFHRELIPYECKLLFQHTIRLAVQIKAVRRQCVEQFLRHTEDFGVHRIVDIKRFQRHRAVVNQVSVCILQIEMLARQTVILRESVNLGRRNLLKRLYRSGFDEMLQIRF